VIPFQGAFAQDAEDEEVIELSPFVVTGDGDIGYQATSTLAGTRLRTNLRDVASSISIVNEELLQDTASTNIADVLLLTPNTEIGGINGNFSASQGFGAGNPIPELQRDNQQGGVSRIRGLAEADLTRDYFITDIPFDTYNTDRIAVQRGANSALFGLGSPGGVVNHTTIRANFLGNVGRLKLETDEHGTQRASIRYNHEIIDDVLAVRFAGLYDDRQYEQRQAFEVDKRIFGSVLYQITDNIRVQASAEFGERNAARPDYVPPNDGITPWILAGKPVVDNPYEAAELFRGTGDFFPSEANNSTNSRLLSVDTAGASSGFVNYFHDVNNPNPTFGGTPFVRANRGTINDAELMMIRVRPMNRTMKLTGGWYPGGATIDPAIAGFFNSGNVDQQILDRSIYDYRKNLFSGGSSTQGASWRALQGSIEGNWWDNKIGVELAAFDQTFDSWGYNALQGIEQRTIYIDMNRTLIAQDGSGNWIPNPGFGKPAMGGGYGGNNLTSDRESLRATAFLELRAEDFLEESWVEKLLGRLKITGVLQERTTEGSESYGGRGGVDPQTTANALAGGDIFGLSNATYRKGLQFTLPDSGNVDYLSINSLDDVKGAKIGGVPYGSKRDRPLNPSTFVGWDSVSQSLVSFETPVYTLRDNNNFLSSFFAGKEKIEIDSKVLVGQHYLWDDMIVLTGTWRNDKQRSGSISAPAWQPYGDGRGLGNHEDTLDPTYAAGVKDLDLDADEDTTSWGIMIHTPDFIAEHLPWGTTFSIYRSKADNFQPSGGRVNIFNEQIAPVTGATEEEGIIISTMNGKLNARVNWFETGILNNSFDVGGVSASEGILLGLAQQLDNPANVAQGFTAADSQAVLPPQGVIDVNGFVPDWANADAVTNRNSGDNGTQDFTAEGVEIEISYNPTPKWTLLLTVARQETVTSNTYPVLTRYVEDFVIPNWVNSSFAQNYFINEDATQTLAERAQTSIVDPVAQAKTQDGIPAIEQREWRWALNTSYNFGEDSDVIPDWLGDFTIGGGIRWEDEVGIGFGVSENELGNLGLDPNKPFYGPSNTFIDVFARARYALSDKSDLILQVNIKDLTDNDDLVPFFANPDGSKLYRFLQGRLITASATFTF
jgi:outer membrane receptor protein involved in Fe transport